MRYAPLIARCMTGHYGERTVKGARHALMRADIRNAIEFLHSAYRQKLTVKDIAAVAGLSEFYFMRTFQSMAGLFVHQYLTQIRLVRAKGLLSQGQSSAQVASNVGFSIKVIRLNIGSMGDI
ncbi:helix-turn-helix transcriptional regulator [Salmonella enterica]|nr:helix-turn-helix transcriptional regulator [Salmonella enterica]